MMKMKKLTCAVLATAGMALSATSNAATVTTPTGTVTDPNALYGGGGFVSLAGAASNINNATIGTTYSVHNNGPVTYYDNSAGKQWAPDPVTPTTPTAIRGWTHNSAWLIFKPTATQTVQATIDTDPGSLPSGASVTDYHPAFVVWEAPGDANEYGPNRFGGPGCPSADCVPAHFWPQTADWSHQDFGPNGSVGFDLKFVAGAHDADNLNPFANITPASGSLVDVAGVTDGQAGHLQSGPFTLEAGKTYFMVVANAPNYDANGNLVNVPGAFDMSATVSAVPLPAAAWLFAPAIAGLFGFGRRKAVQE